MVAGRLSSELGGPGGPGGVAQGIIGLVGDFSGCSKLVQNGASDPGSKQNHGFSHVFTIEDPFLG